MGPTVTVPQGRLEGSTVDVDGRAVRVFRAVPYATPPTGPRRFRAPEPASSWTGVRDATCPGPAAPQPLGGPLDGLVPGMGVKEFDEEGCLTLDVWAPAGGRDRPVMVWLHGGSFVIGSGSLATYDAARLVADGDVVVVAPNYRLGALGFLSAPGVQPNCGLLDQLLALEWVRTSVDAFGGDPQRVTVFGESAGGGSVLHLLAAPAARGRFVGAIAQSGATNLTLSPDQAGEIGERFLARLGGASGLMALPVGQILDAQVATTAEVVATTIMPFHPMVDGDVVLSRPAEALARGLAAEVGLVAGTTADELRLFLDRRLADLDADRLRRWVPRYLGTIGAPDPEAAGQAVIDAYVGRGGDVAPVDVWAAVLTEGDMGAPTRRVLEAAATRPAGAYGYRFTWPAADPWLGSCHAVDLPFTFASFDREGWGEFVAADADAHRLSAAMREAWCRFAATGDPGWPGYGEQQRTTMVLGRRPEVVDDPDGDIRRVWDEALLP